MTDELVDTRITNALSPETLSAKKHLLIASFLGLMVTKAGLLPNKISALGIEFEKINQQNFICLMTCLLIYFFSTFFIYGCSDYSIWKRNKAKTEISFKLANIFPSFYSISGVYKGEYSLGLLGYMRCIIDFMTPVIVGLYSLYTLINFKH